MNWTTSRPIGMPDNVSNAINAFNNDDKNADMPVKHPETPFSQPISSNANKCIQCGAGRACEAV